MNVFMILNSQKSLKLKINKLTKTGKNMKLFVLNKKLKLAGQNGFIVYQIHKLIIKNFSHLRYIHISCYLKFQIPMGHRQFVGVISQNREYVEMFCINQNNPFLFACQKWIENCM